MKMSFLIGAAAGYVLGARAGRERYEQIVSFGRKVAGSQTVQSSAGVLQAQVDGLTAKAKGLISNKLPGSTPAGTGVNGFLP
ncbi:MAG: hypothetical protein JO147_06285 [Actinobacteria bacterium]|nr:hypothetical protein [Actinomycetota bacterium]